MVDVFKELLETGAEIVKPRLAVGCMDKPILGATSMASESNLAVLAVLRESILFGQPECSLLIGGD